MRLGDRGGRRSVSCASSRVASLVAQQTFPLRRRRRRHSGLGPQRQPAGQRAHRRRLRAARQRRRPGAAGRLGREDADRSHAAARSRARSVDGPMLQRLKTAVTDTAALLRAGRSHPPGRDLAGAARGVRLPPERRRDAARHADGGRRDVALRRPRGDDDAADRAGTAAADRRLHRRPRLDQHHRRERPRRRSRSSPTPSSTSSCRSPAARDGETRRLSQRAGGAPDSLAGAANVTVNGQGPAGVAPEGVPQVLSDLVAPTAGQVLDARRRRLDQPRVQGDARRFSRDVRAAVRAAAASRRPAGTTSTITAEEARKIRHSRAQGLPRHGVQSRLRRRSR